jgi:hypothetical protein
MNPLSNAWVSTGVDVWSWLRGNDQIVIALATVALTLVAGVQIAREVVRGWELKRAARVEVRGPAWLARRSLEAALEAAMEEQSSPFSWALSVSRSESLDRLEAHMLEVLRLGSACPLAVARAASEAFTAFLGFADRLNALAGFAFSTIDSQGAVVPTKTDLETASRLLREAGQYLHDAISQLSVLAPRMPHEADLPNVAFLPQFSIIESGAIRRIGSPSPAI